MSQPQVPKELLELIALGAITHYRVAQATQNQLAEILDAEKEQDPAEGQTQFDQARFRELRSIHIALLELQVQLNGTAQTVATSALAGLAAMGVDVEPVREEIARAVGVPS